jgi:hypothetical protein
LFQKLLINVLRIEKGRQTQSDKRRVSKILTQLGWQPTKAPIRLPSFANTVRAWFQASKPDSNSDKVQSAIETPTESQPGIRKGSKVEVMATGEAGTVIDIEDEFATIKLDVPIQSGGQSKQFTGCSLAEVRDTEIQEAGFSVGDRVRYDFQFWTISTVHPDGQLSLSHATMPKKNLVASSEVEMVRQGAAA